MGIMPSSRNVKEAVMAAIGNLEAMPSDPTRYPGADRSAHAFSLTSQLDDGAIDLVPGWCVLLSAPGLMRNRKDSRSKPMPIMAKEIESILRTGMHLGEAQNVIVSLGHLGDSGINEVIGDTEYHRLVTVESRSLIKVHPGNPPHLTPTDTEVRDLT